MRLRLLLPLLALVSMAALPAWAGQKLTVAGNERTYELVGAAGAPRPLIVALHGNMGTGAQFERFAGWGRFAATNGVVVALPDGLNNAWADGRAASEIKGRAAPAGADDVGFLVALVEHLVAKRIADPRQVYAVGASNGGMMTYRLLCERPDVFAAGAAAIAVLTDGGAERCKPSRPVPVLVMNGTADRIIPWERDRSYMGTEATVAHFRKRNGCTDTSETTKLPDIEPSDNSTVTRIAYACPKGADVVLYRVDGGGHQWPTRGKTAWLERVLGARNRDIEASDEIWLFLKKFGR